jgi:hypothetical protein
MYRFERWYFLDLPANFQGRGERQDKPLRLPARMIPVTELDNIAAARLEDAKALLAAGRFDGAISLCG